MRKNVSLEISIKNFRLDKKRGFEMCRCLLCKKYLKKKNTRVYLEAEVE